jgi:membrane-bound inhibitor of C-type lysozyme
MRSVSKLLVLSSTAIFFLSFASMVMPAFAATAPQFVSYNVSGSGNGHSFSATVNETVSQSSMSGMSDFTIQIGSAMSNFSYSKIMNSSQIILPYFPTIANQSLTYQFHNYTITASITQSGTGSANYDGKTYTLSNYTFVVTASGQSQMSGQSQVMSATGSASVFPSGLVYSASFVANGTDTVNVQLLSTNLALDPSSGSSQTTTSIAVAGSAASVLAGVGVFVAYKRRNSTSEKSGESKPLYHVD